MADGRLRVAVLGDSAMWGQGLRHDDKFAVLAANRIAVAQGRTAVISPFSPRSGAKLLAAELDGTAAVTLPSGATRRFPTGDRAEFYDWYPALFRTDDKVLAFFDGRDEGPARRIAAEVPVTFPTISAQIAGTPAEVARGVDLLIIDGSVNDVGLREVLDPVDGPSLAEMDEALRTFAYDRAKAVLSRARDTFPNALIAVTGYFSPFTPRSDRGRMEDMFKYLSDRAGWALWVNDVLTSGFGWFLFPLNLFGTDVDSLVRQAVIRSEFAHTRGLHWLRRAVAELFESDRRGPGIFFVHPGFRPDNGLFGGGAAFLHEGYRQPGDGGREVSDPLLAERRAAIPRIEQLPALRQARGRLGSGRPERDLDGLARQLGELRDALDGPTSLRAALAELIEVLTDLRRPRLDDGLRRIAERALDIEIGRIEVATFASFLHPNEAGARRYADRIVERHDRHRRLRLRPELTRMVAARNGGHSLRAALRRYRLRPETGLRAVLQHTLVDVIAVELELAPLSPLPELRVVPDVYLHISATRRLRLPEGLSFGSNLRVFDTFGDLHLGDVTMLALEIEPDVRWFLVRRFRFLVNGLPVFTSSEPVALGSIRFDYPS